MDELDEGRTAPQHTINPLNQQPYSSNFYRLLAQRKQLPMWAFKDQLVEYVGKYPITLLIGETGSGKSTQLPQFLFSLEPKGRIVCTQPRRVAAMSVAMRVADEMDVRCGEQVGYSVRFEERKSESTKIIYMTDGILLRDLAADRDLATTSVVVVDEAHERTINSDLILALLKDLSRRRTDFRLVVMSATLDAQRFSEYFKNAPVIRVPGRVFPVSVFYSQAPVADYLDAAVNYAIYIHKTEPAGDILVFLTGENQIERACHRFEEALRRLLSSEQPGGGGGGDATAAAENERDSTGGGERRGGVPRAKVLPLHGTLPMEEQRRVFLPADRGQRKVIFATNIAETSLTIDGIVYVVDCGWAKQKLYHPDNRTDCLLPVMTSRAEADQRKGRAGRTRPGKCFRLYCEKNFPSLPAQCYAEIMRTNLTDTVLQMLSLGISNVVGFDYLDAPAPAAIADALTQLCCLGAISEDVSLTPFGQLMSKFPLDACTARMLIRAPQHGCSAEIAVIAALLQGPNVFYRPSRSAAEADAAKERFSLPQDGDHITLFRVYWEYVTHHCSAQFCNDNYLNFRSLQQAEKVHKQLVTMMERHNLPVISSMVRPGVCDSPKVRYAIADGFFLRTAMLPKGSQSYVSIKEKQVADLHPSSVLAKVYQKPKYVVHHQMELHGAEGTVMRTVTPVELDWLPELSADFFHPIEISVPEAARDLTEAFARMERRHSMATAAE